METAPDETLYQMLAPLFLALVMMGVATAGFFHTLRHRERAIRHYTAQGRWIVLVLALQSLALVTAGVFRLMDLVPEDVILGALGNCLFVGMAGLALPLALDLAGEMKTATPARWSERKAVLIGTGTAVVFSAAWMTLAHYVFGMRMTESFGEVVSTTEGFMVFVPIVLVAPFVEEVLFRGGLQGLLEKGCARVGLPVGAAVFGAGAVFAVGHLGMVEPVGIKEVQILVVAMVFGWLKVRYGLRAAIAAHLGLNALSLLVEIGLRVAGQYVELPGYGI